MLSAVPFSEPRDRPGVECVPWGREESGTPFYSPRPLLKRAIEAAVFERALGLLIGRLGRSGDRVVVEVTELLTGAAGSAEADGEQATEQLLQLAAGLDESERTQRPVGWLTLAADAETVWPSGGAAALHRALFPEDWHLLLSISIPLWSFGFFRRSANNFSPTGFFLFSGDE